MLPVRESLAYDLLTSTSDVCIVECLNGVVAIQLL